MKWNDRFLLPAAPATAPSVDQVRLIRRSVRCGLFGLFGLMPVVGLGLAVQAVRLHRQIGIELGEDWKRPVLSWIWLLGMLFMWGSGTGFGVTAAIIALLVFVGLQSWQLWRSVIRCASCVRNPAAHYARMGVVLGYAGVFISLGAFGLAAIWFHKLARVL